MKIKTLSGDQPHPSYRGWRNFLKRCEVRDQHDGVTYYGVSNCNYILFPCGTLICNYGYHGCTLMNRIRDEGKEIVLASIKSRHKEQQG